MTVDKYEQAWAAGFFDGEGSVHIAYAFRSKKTGRILYYCQVAVGQSGPPARNILRRFRKAIGGFGSIYGPLPPAKNQKKTRYIFEASGFEKTKKIRDTLWRWLSKPKREKFEFVLKKYKTCRKK